MSRYVWVIDKDLTACGEDAGVFGPRGATKEDLSRCTIPFQMYDDDGELYYSGRMSEECDGFEPLDDFGMPNAGCTIIKLRNAETGEWEIL